MNYEISTLTIAQSTSEIHLRKSGKRVCIWFCRQTEQPGWIVFR